MANSKLLICSFILITFLLLKLSAHAENSNELKALQRAYPEYIHTISDHTLIWNDGTHLKIDKIQTDSYQKGIPDNMNSYRPINDAGRNRNEKLFRKMYGHSKQDVMKNLAIVYWMPNYFSKRYPLLVTTVNHVNIQLQHVSRELETLVASHPTYLAYLQNPAGTFMWRKIAGAQQLSPHSFGIAIDINANLSDYWQWDLQKTGKTINEEAPLNYHNQIPWKIIPVFEKYGFIWGGKWKHYDTMHFEYRPELLN